MWLCYNQCNFSTFQPGFGLLINVDVENVNGPPKTSFCVLSTEMFWCVDVIPMCHLFVMAQKQYNFPNFPICFCNLTQ
jgi:hypothetical protein